MTADQTTAAELHVPALTDADLAALERDIRGALRSGLTKLGVLRAVDAHTRRGFDTWHGYVVARFGDLLAQYRMPRDERRALVASMSTAGVPVAEQADVLGVGVATVQADRDHLGLSSPRGPRKPRTRPVAAPPVVLGVKYRAACALLAAAADGLTLVELARASGWTEGSASGVLSYLCAPSRGLAWRRDDDRRGGQRVHCLTDAGRLALAAAG